MFAGIVIGEGTDYVKGADCMRTRRRVVEGYAAPRLGNVHVTGRRVRTAYKIEQSVDHWSRDIQRFCPSMYLL